MLVPRCNKYQRRARHSPATSYIVNLPDYYVDFTATSLGTRLEKREVAPLLGAEDLLCIELGITARGTVQRGLGGSGAALKLRVLEHEIDPALLHRKADAVAVLHEAKRPAGGAVGGDVQHDRAEGGATHARVGDADHVLDAAPGKLARDRQIAGLRHGGW